MERSGGVRVQAMANGREEVRIGFAVRRGEGAVIRNRVRRRLREACRPLLGSMVGMDVIVTAGPELAGVDLAMLRRDLERALRAVRAGVRQEERSGGRG